MEPQSIMPSPSSETGGYRQQEHASSQEGSLKGAQSERNATGPEAGKQDSQGVTPPPTFPSLPTPQPTPQVADTPDPTNDTPLVAADDEVIEKAWVDKAKKIVAQTKDDPFTQEKEVSRLQADYLKKRYGKEIKLNPDV